jgi:hypothetical protein
MASKPITNREERFMQMPTNVSGFTPDFLGEVPDIDVVGQESFNLKTLFLQNGGAFYQQGTFPNEKAGRLHTYIRDC